MWIFHLTLVRPISALSSARSALRARNQSSSSSAPTAAANSYAGQYALLQSWPSPPPQQDACSNQLAVLQVMRPNHALHRVGLALRARPPIASLGAAQR